MTPGGPEDQVDMLDDAGLEVAGESEKTMRRAGQLKTSQRELAGAIRMGASQGGLGEVVP
jgi:hypothetical protein